MFNVFTLAHCETLFRTMGQEVTTWTEQVSFVSCKNNLLGICNDLLRRLTHFHNLVPYWEFRVLEASAEDIKLIICIVPRPICKAVYDKSMERELVRQMILKALRKSWTSLDLTKLGY